MEHIKGEWKLKECTNPPRIAILSKDGQICGIQAGVSASGFMSYKELLANARLIAAAPETKRQRDALLAACELALPEITSQIVLFDNIPLEEVEEVDEVMESLVKCEKALKEAIAEAKKC